jgi:hypothetical protein
MADAKTEHSRAVMTDLDGMRKQWFDVGFSAGAEAERKRIQAVEEQGSGFPGHEDLVAKLKYDGKTTGPQAAVQIIAAEKKKLVSIAADLRADAGAPSVNSPVEDTVRTGVQQVDGSMSQEQVADIAKREWATNPNLHKEFTGEAQYCAFKKAEAAGRIRVLNTRRKN